MISFAVVANGVQDRLTCPARRRVAQTDRNSRFVVTSGCHATGLSHSTLCADRLVYPLTFLRTVCTGRRYKGRHTFGLFYLMPRTEPPCVFAASACSLTTSRAGATRSKHRVKSVVATPRVRVPLESLEGSSHTPGCTYQPPFFSRFHPFVPSSGTAESRSVVAAHDCVGAWVAHDRGDQPLRLFISVGLHNRPRLWQRR
jgi:hypothetical protein